MQDPSQTGSTTEDDGTMHYKVLGVARGATQADIKQVLQCGVMNHYPAHSSSMNYTGSRSFHIHISSDQTDDQSVKPRCLLAITNPAQD